MFEINIRSGVEPDVHKLMTQTLILKGGAGGAAAAGTERAGGAPTPRDYTVNSVHPSFPDTAVDNRISQSHLPSSSPPLVIDVMIIHTYAFNFSYITVTSPSTHF